MASDSVNDRDAVERRDSRPQVVSIDVGGTFIDLVSIDQRTGAVTIEKQPATPDRLAEELVMGLERLVTYPGDITSLMHGSTVAINTLLQRRGARVGLITTKGFRDVLELGRGNRPSIYDWVWTPPEPLVARSLRREVSGRMDHRGKEIEHLDRQELAREVERLVEGGVEAIAICFLHSYANPQHERDAAAAIASGDHGVPVTISSDVAAEWHEYERTSTTVINAYLGPIVADYLGSLRERLAVAGVEAPINIMQSNGGSMTLERAAALPVRTLASGPAGGVVGASVLARELGHGDVICADVGGTTLDVAVIVSGQVQERSETEVDGLPVLAPTVDIVSIGAGGGSIAWFDDAGALRVGPRSAGARPGPACFGLGGEEPTVTDCQLVLGRLDPERFLGSRMVLDVDAARNAIEDGIARRLGMTVEEAAIGVAEIAENAMANALHAITVERGLDPREFVLYPYGGGGGLVAASIAQLLGMTKILIPRDPATFSAWGISTTARREDASTTRVRLLDHESLEAAVGELELLREDVVARLGVYGASADVRFDRQIEMRFEGQEHTIPVDLDDVPDGASREVLADRFVDRHRQLFGHGDRTAAIELVTLRCRGTLPAEAPTWSRWQVSEPSPPRAERSVTFGPEGSVPTSVYDWEGLALDHPVVGPAVIEEWTSTMLVPAGWSASVDRLGDIELTESTAATGGAT